MWFPCNNRVDLDMPRKKVPLKDGFWVLVRFAVLKLQLQRQLDRPRPADLVEGVEAVVRAARTQTVRQRFRVTEGRLISLSE